MEIKKTIRTVKTVAVEVGRQLVRGSGSAGRSL